MLSLAGRDEGNEKQQVAVDAWGHQEADRMSFSVYFIFGSPLRQPLLSPNACLITVSRQMLRRLKWHILTSDFKYEKGRVMRSCVGLPCSGPPTVWRWQRDRRRSSSWPWKQHMNKICTFLYLYWKRSYCASLPTWQSLCEWSRASCIWSSRSRFRRFWTGPRSSETSSSSCKGTNTIR